MSEPRRRVIATEIERGGLLLTRVRCLSTAAIGTPRKLSSVVIYNGPRQIAASQPTAPPSAVEIVSRCRAAVGLALSRSASDAADCEMPTERALGK